MVAKQKILIVDDDNNIAELISLYLTKECYDTRIVNDGEEALIAFEQYNPNLILLDLMLPGMDGYQATHAIRNSGRTDAKTIPIIAMTANAFDDDRRKTQRAGMNAHLSKPLDVSELLNTLEKFREKNIKLAKSKNNTNLK